MSATRTTKILILVAAVVLVAWDIYAAAFGGTGATISEVALAFAMRHPVLPFGVGVIFGHLFWPQKSLPTVDEEPKK